MYIYIYIIISYIAKGNCFQSRANEEGGVAGACVYIMHPHDRKGHERFILIHPASNWSSAWFSNQWFSNILTIQRTNGDIALHLLYSL